MNKKGFTLVELLAVIVILAIILAIAVPIIGNLISNARTKSFENGAKMVLKTMKLDFDEKVTSNGSFLDTFILYDNGVRTVYPSSNNLDFSISATDGGIVRHNDGTVTLALYDGNSCVTKTRYSNDLETTATDKVTCLEKIYYKQGSAPFTNLIINGDFSNGLNNWNNYYTAYSELAIENNYLVASGDVGGFFIGQFIPVIAENIYYSYWTIKLTEEITSNRIYFALAGGYSSYFPNDILKYQWKNISRISTGTSTGSSRFDIMSYSPNYSGKLYVKNVVALNLTSDFGAGNEPTQVQMDQNINKVWIDTANANTPKKFTGGGWVNF